MTRKPTPTRAERALLKSERSALRTVTLAEKLASKGRLSLGGAYLVPKTIAKVGAQTVVVTTTRFKDFAARLLGLPTRDAAAALRKVGLLGYKSAAAEEQATKQRATKATPLSRRARIKKAIRHARRQKAASKEGFERGRKQQERVAKYLDEKYEQHEKFVKTGNDKYKLNEDEYRKVVHLMYEFHGDDKRMIERMHASPTVMGLAA